MDTKTENVFKIAKTSTGLFTQLILNQILSAKVPGAKFLRKASICEEKICNTFRLLEVENLNFDTIGGASPRTRAKPGGSLFVTISSA